MFGSSVTAILLSLTTLLYQIISSSRTAAVKGAKAAKDFTRNAAEKLKELAKKLGPYLVIS